MTEDKLTFDFATLAQRSIPSLPDSTANPAKWAHERVVKSIVDFEKDLNEEQEIGARLVSFANNEIIHIDNVGYWGPDIITFYGRTADNHPVELLQHISQLNVLLVAVPKTETVARRIGFELEKSLKEVPE